jgi:hypothetical protein
VVLHYDRGDHACPDRAALEAMVKGALGRDPFRQQAERSIEARIAKVEEGLEARIVVREGGAITGERTLSDPDPGCAELARAVALAISVAIDPLIFRRSIDPPVSTSTVSPPPAPPPRTDPSPVTEVRSTEVTAGLGVHAVLGTVPSLTGSMRLGAQLGWPSFTLDVEVRFDLPRSIDYEGRERVTVWLAAASVVPCYRYAWFSACAVGAAGAVKADGMRDPTSAWAAIGLRAAFTIQLTNVLYGFLHLEGLATLLRTTLYYVGDLGTAYELWTSPLVSGSIGAGLAVRFP